MVRQLHIAFKIVRMFFWLSRMHVTSGMQHFQNFIEVEHRKGDYDGARTCEIGNTLVSLGNYKLVLYGIEDGKELKRCELVKSDVCVADFRKLFQEKIFYDYTGHTHRTRWLDEKFNLCKEKCN